MKKFLFAVLLLCWTDTASASLASECTYISSDVDKSIAACTRLIEQDSRSEWLASDYSLRGFAYYKKGTLDAAIADFSEALRLDTSNNWRWNWQQTRPSPNPVLWRGMALYKLDRYTEAIQDFDQFINWWPNIAAGHYGRGLALEASGLADWALASYSRALELSTLQGREYYSDLAWRLPIDIVDVMRRRDALQAQIDKDQSGVEETSPAADLLASRLYEGKTSEALTLLTKYTTDHPTDQTGHFALGAARFVQAIEHLGQSLYRYGLESPHGIIVSELPFLRFPVPPNPSPEKFTYDDARTILQTFVADLAAAETSLARVDDPKAAIPVNIGLVRLDLNSDGKASENEALWLVFARVSSARIDQQSAQNFTLRFDSGDAAWMRGYGHLMSAMSEFLLAYDWHDDFNHSFHRFFPRAQLPYAALDELFNAQRPQWDAYYKCYETGRSDCWELRPTETSPAVDPFMVEIADVLTLVHLMHWPVKEPERMTNVLHHLEMMTAMSRLSWKQILAETDNDHEWIPSPAQTGMLPGMAVNQSIVDGWLGVMDQLDALLQGKMLLGHWRLAKGINMRRVFLEPADFDPILWAQGSAAVPYLEDGAMAQGDTWRRLENIFGGNFFNYAVWLN